MRVAGYANFNLKLLVADVCRLAREAGEVIAQIYQQDIVVTQKRDSSPLTSADLASHDLLVKRLNELTPDIPVLSEEDANIPYEERRRWQYYWLIDPLDGTREFIKRNGEFTVNISLICDSLPILGVIYAPILQECYFAYAQGGAYRQSAQVPAMPIRTRAWDGGHITIAGSRAHRTQSYERFLNGFVSHEMILLGSALKSCVVAQGRADIYARFGPTSEWDTAAAQCIVEEAGGKMLGLDGRPLRYNQKRSLLNPSFLVVGDPRHAWLNHVPEANR